MLYVNHKHKYCFSPDHTASPYKDLNTQELELQFYLKCFQIDSQRDKHRQTSDIAVSVTWTFQFFLQGCEDILTLRSAVSLHMLLMHIICKCTDQVIKQLGWRNNWYMVINLYWNTTDNSHCTQQQ